MESARNNFWLAGHVPNFKNASSRLPFQWISFNFFKLIQTNDNRTHHSQSAGSFYRLHWNTVDMNSCRTQWCSYMKRNCGSCVNRWCIHQHLRMEIQGADVSNIFYLFKATCNSWFLLICFVSHFPRFCWQYFSLSTAFLIHLARKTFFFYCVWVFGIFVHFSIVVLRTWNQIFVCWKPWPFS